MSGSTMASMTSTTEASKSSTGSSSLTDVTGGETTGN